MNSRDLDPSSQPASGQPPSANRRNVSVGKAAAVLRAAAAMPDGSSVSELARSARLPRATALRMIDALEAEGLLTRRRDRDLVLLGTAILELAAAVRPERLLIDGARPALERLARRTAETVTLAVRHGDEIVGIDEVPGAHLIGPSTWVGRAWPLHGTATGRLALGTVAADAVAESVDELEVGLASIAAVIPRPGPATAYVTVSGPSYRFDAAARATAGTELLQAVAEIARDVR
jgi:DNA-binding IclR family transcriptional regulator